MDKISPPKIMKMERASRVKKHVYEKIRETNGTLGCNIAENCVRVKKEDSTNGNLCKSFHLISNPKKSETADLCLSSEKKCFFAENLLTPLVRGTDDLKFLYDSKKPLEDLEVTYNEASSLHLKDKMTKTQDVCDLQSISSDSSVLKDICNTEEFSFVAKGEEAVTNIVNYQVKVTNMENFANDSTSTIFSAESVNYEMENDGGRSSGDRQIYNHEIDDDVDSFQECISVLESIDHENSEKMCRLYKNNNSNVSDKVLISPLKYDQNVAQMDTSSIAKTSETMCKQNICMPAKVQNCNWKFVSEDISLISSDNECAISGFNHCKLVKDLGAAAKVNCTDETNYSSFLTFPRRRSKRIMKKDFNYGLKTDCSYFQSPPRKRRNSTHINKQSIYSFFFDWLLLNSKFCEITDFDLPDEEFGTLKEEKLQGPNSDVCLLSSSNSFDIPTSRIMTIPDAENIEMLENSYLSQSNIIIRHQQRSCDDPEELSPNEKRLHSNNTDYDSKFVSENFCFEDSENLNMRDSKNTSHLSSKSHFISESDDIENILNFSSICLDTQEIGENIQNFRSESYEPIENSSSMNSFKSSFNPVTFTSDEAPNAKRLKLENLIASDIVINNEKIHGGNSSINSRIEKDFVDKNILVRRLPETPIRPLSPLISIELCDSNQHFESENIGEYDDLKDDCVTPSLFHQMEMSTVWEPDCEEILEPKSVTFGIKNFSFMAHLESIVNEPVSRIHLTVVNNITMALVQHVTEVAVWKQVDENCWEVGGCYNIGMDSKILDSCLLKDSHDVAILLLYNTNGKQCMKLIYLNGNLAEMQVMEHKEWSNGNVGEKIFLCGLQNLMFATAVGDEVFSVSVHLFKHDSNSPNLSTVKLSTVSDLLLNLCAVDELPKALLGCSMESMYIWLEADMCFKAIRNYITGNLVTIVNLTPVPSERFHTCAWAKSEKGLLYLMMTIIEQDYEYTCQLIVVNPTTGLWDCIQRYTHEDHQQCTNKNYNNVIVHGRYVLASCCGHGFLWDLLSGNKIASLMFCNLTYVTSVCGHLAVGLHCGCTNVYHLSEQ